MRIEINLASQPYGEMQRFLLRWGAALALQSFLSWRTLEQQANRLQRQIAAQDRKKTEVDAYLNRAENRETRQRAQFLNELLARKAFCWTEVFTDLERLMPPRLRVQSLHPEVNGEGQLELQLVVTGPVREAAIELVRRLEESPHFTQAQIKSETLQKAQVGQAGPVGGADQVQYGITAIYLPKFERPPEAEGGAAGEPGEGAPRERVQKLSPAGKSAAREPAPSMEAHNAHR